MVGSDWCGVRRGGRGCVRREGSLRTRMGAVVKQLVVLLYIVAVTYKGSSKLKGTFLQMMRKSTFYGFQQRVWNNKLIIKFDVYLCRLVYA